MNSTMAVSPSALEPAMSSSAPLSPAQADALGSRLVNPIIIYADLMLKAAMLNQWWMNQINQQIGTQNARAVGAGEASANLQGTLRRMSKPDDRQDLPPDVKTFCQTHNVKIQGKDGAMDIERYLASIAGKDGEAGKALDQEQLTRIQSALDAFKDQASNQSNQLNIKIQQYLQNYNNAFQAASNAIKANGDLIGGLIRNQG